MIHTFLPWYKKQLLTQNSLFLVLKLADPRMKNLILLLFLFFGLQTKAQTIQEQKLSSCDESAEVDLIQTRLVEKKIENGALLLSIGFAANCCYAPESAIRMSNDTLYLTTENSSDTYCLCTCCFELEFKITGILDTNFVLMLGTRELKKVSKYVKLPDDYHFDKKTPINQLDENNQKIGLWKTYYGKSKKVQLEQYFITDQTGNYEAWSRSFTKEGDLVEVTIKRSAKGARMHFDAKQYSRILETK